MQLQKLLLLMELSPAMVCCVTLTCHLYCVTYVLDITSFKQEEAVPHTQPSVCLQLETLVEQSVPSAGRNQQKNAEDRPATCKNSENIGTLATWCLRGIDSLLPQLAAAELIYTEAGINSLFCQQRLRSTITVLVLLLKTETKLRKLHHKA